MVTPYNALEKLFHEPNRLAIMSELSGVKGGVSFNELKDRCELTDGNLSRHLAVLEKAKAIRIEKKFVDSKPRTTVFITPKGRNAFLKYLTALEEVLKEAAKNTKPQQQKQIAALSAAKATKS